MFSIGELFWYEKSWSKGRAGTKVRLFQSCDRIASVLFDDVSSVTRPFKAFFLPSGSLSGPLFKDFWLQGRRSIGDLNCFMRVGQKFFRVASSGLQTI